MMTQNFTCITTEMSSQCWTFQDTYEILQNTLSRVEGMKLIKVFKFEIFLESWDMFTL